MLSVFSLKSALDESVGFGGSVNVAPYDFVGDLDESTFLEANYEIMSEAAAIDEFITASDEAMVESVIGGSLTEAQQIALSENVFEQIWNGIRKFIDKVIAMVKGLINKLKAFFFKFTGKTDKWLSIMKDPISKAKGRGGADKFKYTMHKWDRDFVVKGLSDACNSLVDDKKSFNTIKKDLATEVKDLTADANKFKGGDPQDQAIKNDIDDADKTVEKTNADKDTRDEELMKDACTALKVSASDMNGVWREVEKRATGGEKIEIAIYSDVENMISAIENSKKTIDSLKAAYKKNLDALSDMRKEIDKFDTDLKKINDKVPDNLAAAYRRVISAKVDYAKHSITIEENLLNTAQSKNLKYVQSMTSEYMSALSKFSGIKDKKD